MKSFADVVVPKEVPVLPWKTAELKEMVELQEMLDAKLPHEVDEAKKAEEKLSDSQLTLRSELAEKIPDLLAKKQQIDIFLAKVKEKKFLKDYLATPSLLFDDHCVKLARIIDDFDADHPFNQNLLFVDFATSLKERFHFLRDLNRLTHLNEKINVKDLARQQLILLFGMTEEFLRKLPIEQRKPLDEYLKDFFVISRQECYQAYQDFLKNSQDFFDKEEKEPTLSIWYKKSLIDALNPLSQPYQLPAKHNAFLAKLKAGFYREEWEVRGQIEVDYTRACTNFEIAKNGVHDERLLCRASFVRSTLFQELDKNHYDKRFATKVLNETGALLQAPYDERAQKHFATLTQHVIGKRSWGKLLGGAMLMLMGSFLIAASAFIKIFSLGLSTPWTIATMTVGAALIYAGVCLFSKGMRQGSCWSMNRFFSHCKTIEKPKEKYLQTEPFPMAALSA